VGKGVAWRGMCQPTAGRGQRMNLALTANLPLRKTKLLGSFFFAGSWPSVRCVLFFFCGGQARAGVDELDAILHDPARHGRPPPTLRVRAIAAEERGDG
jgi:hypothetical protein